MCSKDFLYPAGVFSCVKTMKLLADRTGRQIYLCCNQTIARVSSESADSAIHRGTKFVCSARARQKVSPGANTMEKQTTLGCCGRLSDKDSEQMPSAQREDS